METLSEASFDQLLRHSDDICVSIYMTTTPANFREDKSRLRDLIQKSERKISILHGNTPIAAKLNEKLRSLLDQNLWTHQGKGLAYFLSPNYEETYFLPYEFDSYAAVDTSFHISPLLHLMERRQKFYVLALNQSQVKLYNCSYQGIKSVKVPGLPENATDALWYRQTEKLGERRQIPGAGSVHGEGDEAHQAGVWVTEFLQKVDQALAHYLKNSREHLLLAASSPMQALYRGICSYRYLLPNGIQANPQRTDVKKIHAESIKIMEKIYLKPAERAFNIFTEFDAKNSPKVTVDPADSLKAARNGKIDTLLISKTPVLAEGFGEELGSGNEVSNVFQNLIEAAVRETLLRGGRVYQANRLPHGAPVGAIFRY
jgi:hypothetical protein